MKISLVLYLILLLYLTNANVDAFNIKEFFEKLLATFKNKNFFKSSNTTTTTTTATTTTATTAHVSAGHSSLTERSINIVIDRRDVISSMKKRAASAAEGAKALEKPTTCNEDQLMVYLAEIQAINPESIINLSTFDELQVICKQVGDSLYKVDCFLKTCQIENDKGLYIQLIKGVDKLYSVLCDEKCPFKKDFEMHFACLKQLHEDFETCFGPPDWTESLSRSEICRSYKDIADCYYIKAAKVCGKPAAKVMKHLVKTVVDAIIPVHCTSVLLNPHVESALDSRKKCSDSENHKLASILMVLNIIVLIN